MINRSWLKFVYTSNSQLGAFRVQPPCNTYTYHDILHPLALFAEYVLHRNLHIVQLDESRAASLAAAYGDLLHADALLVL